MVKFALYADFVRSSVFRYISIPDYKVFFLESELLPFTVRQKAEIYWLLGYICILLFAKR